MIKQQSTSPRSLSRLFSDDDTTFSDFLRYQRIIRSLELMADNTMSLKEIAYDTGFSTPANFNRSFKMVLGIAPSEMRRRQRE
jgi:transcriptional regulator GlxA family with amidase domain